MEDQLKELLIEGKELEYVGEYLGRLTTDQLTADIDKEFIDAVEKEFMTPDNPIKPIGILAGRGSGKPSRRIIIITTSAARNRPDTLDELMEKLRGTECVPYPTLDYVKEDKYVPNYWPKTPPILLKSIPYQKYVKKPYKQRLKRVKR